MQKKISIIGAGTAGLAAGVRLQHLGYDVTIFEKNEKVGGRMYQFEIDGFKFDVGPTIVMMKELYEEVFEFTGVSIYNYLDMVRIEPMLKLIFKDGMKLDASSDLVKMTADHEAFSEEDAAGYLKYLSNIYKRYLVAKNHFLNRSFRKPLDFYNPKSLYQGLKLRTLNNAYDEISKYVKSEKLRQALAFQTLYIGVSPFSGPSIYTIIPMIELLYGVYYIKGGMYEMAKAMEKRFYELGGKIHFNANVNEILIGNNNNAYGVKVNNFDHLSDIVLSNADFPYAMDNLIKNNKHKKKYTPKKVDKMEYSTSSFMLYLGMDKKYDLNLHNIYFTEDFRKNINDIFEDINPKDPSFYVYSPSQIDDSMAPDGNEVLYVLVPVPNLHHSKNTWDEDAINNYSNKILDLMSKYSEFSDIKEHIKVKKIFTPKDFEQMFNLKHGATFGLRPTLKQSNYFRPQTKSKYVNNLYFAGSSNHPGAGVPIVLQSAKIATDDIIKDDKNYEFKERLRKV